MRSPVEVDETQAAVPKMLDGRGRIAFAGGMATVVPLTDGEHEPAAAG